MKKMNQSFDNNSFFTADGKLDIKSEKPLTVAFIGGSLTECETDYEGTKLDKQNGKWTESVCDFFRSLFPHRKVSSVNAGLGGTGSHYGAVRFEKDVLSYGPDIVFIEFSCNDCPECDADCEGQRKAERQIYLESMIRRCIYAKKIPAIIYMHVPLPYEGEAERLYKVGCDLKKSVLNYYRVGTVDAMAYMLRKFDEQKAENPELTRKKFYEDYYPQYENAEFNVHPYSTGYGLFAEAIIEAISRAPEKYLHTPAKNEAIYCQNGAKEINLRYGYVSADDARISYTGEWKLYTADCNFKSATEALLIDKSKLTDAQQFPEGVMQIFMPRNASISFTTEADKICLPHVSSVFGLSADVYVNGEFSGRLSCNSCWHGMNYMGDWIPLKKGKKQVCIKIDESNKNESVFRFGYIVEAFEEI